tara:strand:- start:169 stop:1689 length:1521 start_codon:yes stop_codon:yes gene_type:complete
MKNKWKIYTTSKLVEELCKEFDELAFVDTELKIFGRGKNVGSVRTIWPLMSLVFLVKKIYMGYYKHNTFSEYSSIHYKTIDSWFGKDNRDTINILLEHTEGWKKNDFTRGWKLKDKTERVLDEHFSRIVRQKRTNKILGLDGKRLVRLPKNGIVSRDIKDRPMKNKERFENNLSSIIDINFENIQNCIDLIRQISDTGNIQKNNLNKWTKSMLNLSPEELTHRRNTLSDLREISDSELLPKGQIYQHYFETDSGRVYTQGNTSLQQMYRDIREIVMGGLDYWDYDISNCHYTIMKQIGDYYGVKCGDSFNHYINNKKQIRTDLAFKLNIDVRIIKSVLIAILYGASRVVSDECEITKLLGHNKHRELNDDPFIDGLFKDRDILTNQIIDITEREPGVHRYLRIKGRTKLYYENIRNKRLFVYEDGKKVTKRRVLAHLLQGLESKMLDICLGKGRHRQIKVLIHDGFISDGTLSETDMVSDILEGTGISVVFDKKPLNCILNQTQQI